MSRVTVEPRAAAMLKKLKKLTGQIENPAPILDALGDLFRKTTTSVASTAQTSPTGKRWKRSKASRSASGARPSSARATCAIRSARCMSAGKVEIGTDIFYGRIHQTGGKIDATYKAKGGARGSAGLNLRPGASSAVKLAQSALRRQRQRKLRNVRLPARKFLGVSKRDRKRTTQILITGLSEALK